MKHIFYFLLFCFILISCKQSDLEYSCDPDLNQFVVENKSEFAQISVVELASYDVALQRAVFRSWDAEKKRSAWIEKLQKVSNSLSLNSEEKNHVQKLIDHIDIDYFTDENIQNNADIRAKFANEWISYSSYKLGWSVEFISFLVYRLYTNQSQFDAELNALKSLNTQTTTNSESGTCNCNISTDFCSGSSCRSTGCSISNSCGWLWSSQCNGNC